MSDRQDPSGLNPWYHAYSIVNPPLPSRGSALMASDCLLNIVTAAIWSSVEPCVSRRITAHSRSTEVPMTVRPHGIVLTREVFARMIEYLPDSPPGLVDVFIEGRDLGQAQESLTTVLLPAMRSAAQARAQSTRGRGLVVLDQRKGGTIWYLDHQAARAAFQQVPIEIWYQGFSPVRWVLPI